jgi:hypothetical protein
MTVTSFHPASDADDTLAYRTHLQNGQTGLNWASGLRLLDCTLGHSHFRGPAVGALVHFLTLERRRPHNDHAPGTAGLSRQRKARPFSNFAATVGAVREAAVRRSIENQKGK